MITACQSSKITICNKLMKIIDSMAEIRSSIAFEAEDVRELEKAAKIVDELFNKVYPS